MQFKYAKLLKSYEQIERNWPNCQFLVKNYHFLVKNGPKMGKIDFSQNFHWAIIVLLILILLDHKCSFYKKNQQNPMTGFGENGQNGRFWAKMVYF